MPDGRVGEGAWASRALPRAADSGPLRLDKHPTVLPESSWKAQVRRWKRYRRLGAKGQHVTVGTVAMARELGGCMGAMADRGAGDTVRPKNRLPFHP